jgi:hypothetical protein
MFEHRMKAMVEYPMLRNLSTKWLGRVHILLYKAERPLDCRPDFSRQLCRVKYTSGRQNKYDKTRSLRSQTIARTAESSSLHDSLVAAPEVKVGRRAVAGEQDLLRFGYAQPSLMGVPDYFSARKYSMTLFDRLTGNTCAGSCTSQ